MAKGRALGKGLGALIPGASGALQARGGALMVPIEHVLPNPEQPRKQFDEDALLSLAASIREHGVVQPLIVQRKGDNYLIVAGERRWRAAKLAKLEELPVRIFEGSDQDVIEVSLIENVQREDLSPLEIARGLRDLMGAFDLTQDEVARKLGWSRSAVANKIRLLNLPESIQDMLFLDQLSEGHARTLLALSDEKQMLDLARLSISRSWSVRQLEAAVRGARKAGEGENVHAAPSKSCPLPSAANRISSTYGVGVKLSGRGDRMKVTFSGLDRSQISLLCEIMEQESKNLFPDR